MMQALSSFLEHWLAPVASLVEPVYPWVNGLHVLSIGVLGTIALLDLRLLGAFRHVSVSQLAATSIQLAASGLVGAILTGLLLFSVQPAHYLTNPAFLAKLPIVAVGLLNITLLRLSPDWPIALADGPIPGRVKAAAAISLTAWVAAVFAGRWIGFL